MAEQFSGNPSTSTPETSHRLASANVSENGQMSTGETLSSITLDETVQQQSGNSSLDCGAGDVGSMLSPTNSRIDRIGKRAQDLIERINERRAMDQHVMNSFEEKLMKKVSEVCQQVREQMFDYYEQHSQRMEASITEMSEVLERSSQLSMELQEASQTLKAINKNLQEATEH